MSVSKLKKTMIILLGLTVVNWFVHMFVGSTAGVVSTSMNPTLVGGDIVWINKISYGARMPMRWSEFYLLSDLFKIEKRLAKKNAQTKWSYRRALGFGNPQENDIIVFNSVEDERLNVIKRVAAIKKKGDEIPLSSTTFDQYKSIILRDGLTPRLLNGKVYINDRKVRFYKPKVNYYYVLGDNTITSRDSRVFGYIPEYAIIGKVNLIFFSKEKSISKKTYYRQGRFFLSLE